MNAVKKDVENLVEKELNSANEQFPLFASMHEGYAVMLEEFEKAEWELEQIRNELYYMWQRYFMWQRIKKIENKGATSIANCIKNYAIDLACEAIQVAAMAEKMIVSERKRNENRNT